jgi:predicted SnoaL-like aldol condensation-catalyzing enzyme
MSALVNATAPTDSSHVAMAKAFLQEVVSNETIDHAYDTYLSPNFRHHNIYFPSDANSLKEGMRGSNEMFPRSIVETKMVMEQGEMVSVHSSVTHYEGMTDKIAGSYACIHTFRFEDEKIVELWDVFMKLPETIVNELGPF